jgi:hypothetical protein
MTPAGVSTVIAPEAQDASAGQPPKRRGGRQKRRDKERAQKALLARESNWGSSTEGDNSSRRTSGSSSGGSSIDAGDLATSSSTGSDTTSDRALDSCSSDSGSAASGPDIDSMLDRLQNSSWRYDESSTVMGVPQGISMVGEWGTGVGVCCTSKRHFACCCHHKKGFRYHTSLHAVGCQDSTSTEAHTHM